MDNFNWCNPTRVIFGKGQIAAIADFLPKTGTVFMLYGGGSIRKNGVYDQVKNALGGRKVEEFGGIEANPRYETCMKAVAAAKKAKASFILAVGGGSVVDGGKFIAAALKFKGRDPWDILAKKAPVLDAVPIACVLTLPATGTEANPNSVISRDSTNEKLAFASDKVRPVFSILDPETTYTLDKRQTVNGIVDAYIHVCEQYLTYPNQAPLQDRQAEAILKTIVEIGPKLLKSPKSYDLRADMMYSAYQALNQHIAQGVPQDWATHDIGHELTALYDLDHAVTLAIVQPGVWTIGKKAKAAKLAQYAERVWDITKGSAAARAQEAIDKTENFYRSLGIKTLLSEYKHIGSDAPSLVRQRLEARKVGPLGEHGDITPEKVEKLLKLRWK